ncbi:MAG: NINE protein [Bdellovibrionota bacterium]
MPKGCTRNLWGIRGSGCLGLRRVVKWIGVKSLGTAYGLLLVFGALGAHQFYLGRPWRGVVLVGALGVSYLSYMLQLGWWELSVPLGVVGALAREFSEILRLCNRLHR